MAYRINKNALFTDDSFYEGWQRHSVAKDLGECYIDCFVLEPGLSIVYSSYTPNRDIIEESIIERSNSTLSLAYGLKAVHAITPKTASARTLFFLLTTPPYPPLATVLVKDFIRRFRESGNCALSLMVAFLSVTTSFLSPMLKRYQHYSSIGMHKQRITLNII